MGRNDVYVSSGTVNKALEETARAVSELNERKGLNLGLELSSVHVDEVRDHLDEYKEQFDEQGIEVGSIHAPMWNNLSSEDQTLVDKGLSEVHDAIDLASELGAGRVVVHPGYEFCDPEWEEAFGITDRGRLDIAYRSVCEVASYAAEKGVIVAFENLDFVGSTDMERLLALVERDRVINPDLSYARMTLDLGHFNIRGRHVESLIERYGDEIVHTHLHYNDGDTDAHAPLGPDTSHGAVKEYRSAIEALGRLPDTTHTLELHLKGTYDECAEELGRSVDYLQDAGYF